MSTQHIFYLIIVCLLLFDLILKKLLFFTNSSVKYVLGKGFVPILSERKRGYKIENPAHNLILCAGC